MNTMPMISTPITVSGDVYGARLRVESVASTHAWKQRPALAGFAKIDNTIGVSARKRRHR